jgi:hypothetical protein
MLMHTHHYTMCSFVILMKEALKDMDDEVHRCVMWPLASRYGRQKVLGFNTGLLISAVPKLGLASPPCDVLIRLSAQAATMTNYQPSAFH